MFLRIYSVILTIVFCYLLLNNSTKKSIFNLPSKRIEKEKTILINEKATKRELCSYELNEQNLNFDINFQLERIKKYVEITPEQEEKIIKHSKYNSLSNIFIMPEENISIEQIIGKEKNDLIEEKEREHFNKEILYNSKKQAHYLSKVLNLDEDKEELLISLLSSNDFDIESEAAYLIKQLDLNQTQENQINSLYNDYMVNYENIIKIAKKMSINVEAENFDYYDFGKNLFNQKAKEILDEAQQKKLDDYLKENK